MKELLEKTVKGFVDHPEDVQVEEEPTPDGASVFSLSVNQEDMGKVIGKGGKIAKSLRLLIRIPAIKQNKRVTLEIVERS